MNKIDEGRRETTERLDTFLHPDVNPGMFRRIAAMRKHSSDAEIGRHLGTMLGTSAYDYKTVKAFFNKHQQHKDYVPALVPSITGVPHHDDFTKTVVGLADKGHSTSSIASMLTTEKRKITKNSIVGLLNRTSAEDKQQIRQQLQSGDHPELYKQHKDKPVQASRQKLVSWRMHQSKGTDQMKQKISEAVISKLIEAVGKKKHKPTKEERSEHAGYAFKHISKADEVVRKLLKDENLHPDVRQYLTYFADHTTKTLNGLNKMAMGQPSTKTKKEPSGKM